MLGRIVVVAVSLAFSAAAAAGAGDPFPNFLNLAHFGPAVSGPMDEILAKCAEYNIANEMMEALPYSEALVRMDPGNAMHHYHLARNYLLLNQLAGALFHYNWALQIDQYHTQSEIGTANVGHISKILNVDMVAYNKKNSAALKARSKLGSALSETIFDENDDFGFGDLDVDSEDNWDEDWTD